MPHKKAEKVTLGNGTELWFGPLSMYDIEELIELPQLGDDFSKQRQRVWQAAYASLISGGNEKLPTIEEFRKAITAEEFLEIQTVVMRVSKIQTPAAAPAISSQKAN